MLFTTPDTDEILNAVERYQASGFFGVPALFEYLKEYEKTDRVNWKRLKLIACGADTLHHTTIEGWENRTGSKILEGYGMTETTAVSHGTPYNRPKTGSFGVPLPNVTAAVVDVDGTTFMPVNEVGELILHGPNMMQGYWKRPEDNRDTMAEIDGRTWLRTGDLVRMDEEGYFHFFDRKRDLIKYKGYSVFARHVEEVLYKHPQVKAAGVIGVRDPKVGQFIKAYVVLQSEARGKVSEEEILEFCREQHGPLQGPQDHRVPRRAAEDRRRQGLAPGAARRIGGSLKMEAPFLEIEGLTKSFGGLRAVNDASFFRRAQGDRGPDRPERGRQDRP